MLLKRILIVDDLPEMRIVTRKVLEKLGDSYEILEATNGKEALEMVRTQLPDLIITDWDMPIMNGIEFIKKLRQTEQLTAIPVIIITGLMVSSQDLETAFNAGASDFLRKPFDKTELIARVKSMLLVSQSIKESKAFNKVLMEHNRFVISILSAVPSPLVYYNTDGIIIRFNESFQHIFSHNALAIGELVYSVFPEPLKMKAQSEEMIRNNIKQASFELVMNTRLDEEKTFLITKTIYFNPFQIAEGIICLFSDISEIKDSHYKRIEEKKRELVSSAMRLMQMSEVLDKLIDDLTNLESYSNLEGKKIIYELKSKYNLKSGSNVWKEFETRFEQVYEDFYERLIKVHPDITPGEKKLCALLKLNLSSKEIATLIFQDAKSVDMGRYRLRKKLNLSPDENLIDYLNKI